MDKILHFIWDVLSLLPWMVLVGSVLLVLLGIGVGYLVFR